VAGSPLACPGDRFRFAQVQPTGNEVALRFTRRRGFTETDRCVLPGDEIPYVDPRLA
jgi:hypothetical protein